MRPSIYTPYGAFEMKATYQRNLMFATLSVTGLVALVLMIVALYPRPETTIICGGGSWVDHLDSTVIDLGRELHILPTDGRRPDPVPVREEVPFAVPTPVPDDMFPDEDLPVVTVPQAMEAGRELYPDSTPDGGRGDSGGEGGVGGNGGGGTSDGLWPSPTEFVPLEIPPELIKQYHGEYPRVTREMGLSGRVVVRVLLDEEGHVLVSELARTSGVEALDEVAVKWAKQCVFSPGIQNHRPVKVWVTFTYEFVLDQ